MMKNIGNIFLDATIATPSVFLLLSSAQTFLTFLIVIITLVATALRLVVFCRDNFGKRRKEKQLSKRNNKNNADN